MEIGLVSGCAMPELGGPAAVLRAHAAVIAQSHNVHVFAGVDAGREHELAREWPGASLFRLAWPKRWFRMAGLRRALSEAISHLDVVHAHMLWDHPVWCAYSVCRAAGRPLVVSPHGSMNHSWRVQTPVKLLYRWLFVNRLFAYATLHALTPFERDALRAHGARGRIEVIPNGLPESVFDRAPRPQLARSRWPQLNGRRVALYMGRLWSGKGLDVLPDAWSAASTRDWLLVLAGPDYRGYERNLRQRISSLGLDEQVLLTGPVDGDLKWSLFDAADLFVMPSHSEGFSIALLEGMASRLPCLFTTACHMPGLAESGGGWESSGPDDLADVIRQACRAEDTELGERGQLAWSLGRRDYTLERVGTLLGELYESLGSSRPAH